jgi:hypothetical protein
VKTPAPKTKEELVAGMEEILRKQNQVNVLKPAPRPKRSKSPRLY